MARITNSLGKYSCCCFFNYQFIQRLQYEEALVKVRKTKIIHNFLDKDPLDHSYL